MRIALEFGWPICPDGYTFHDYGEGQPDGTVLTQKAGCWIKPRSDRAKRVQYQIEGGELTMALAFVNARTDAAVLTFCDQHGLPGMMQGDTGVSEMPADEFRRLQGNLRAALALREVRAGLVSDVFAGPMVRLGLKHDASEYGIALVLRPSTLTGLLSAAVSLTLAGTSTVLSCACCGIYFAVGTGRRGGGKRAGARYCSDACRLNAWRARKEAENSA